MLLAARLALFLCLPFLFAAVLSAQDIKVSQATIWASKPDVAAFEKIETDRLAAGQRAIDTLLAAKGPRTIENTLVPFDEAVAKTTPPDTSPASWSRFIPTPASAITPPRCSPKPAPPKPQSH